MRSTIAVFWASENALHRCTLVPEIPMHCVRLQFGAGLFKFEKASVGDAPCVCEVVYRRTARRLPRTP